MLKRCAVSYMLCTILTVLMGRLKKSSFSLKERPACLWCHAPQAECGVHLITCPTIPYAMGLELRARLVLLHAESKSHPLPEDPSTSPLSEPARFEALECLARLHWEDMSSPTLLRTLSFLGDLINNYRKAWRPAPDDHIIVNPI
jgi:hypothetical protein